MKGIKILGMVLAVGLMVFMIAPIASAQTNADILDGQWFKVKASFKGYSIADDEETVLGKGSGTTTTYLLFNYDVNSGYTITTCMQDTFFDTLWHKTVNTPISTDYIYGATYPQVWDFQGNYLRFYDGENTYDIYPTFYTKITADGTTLKNANIVNVACAIYADLVNDEYGLGSCSLSGPLVKPSQVATRVPADCRAP
jgi:hypothetical protein